MYCYCDLGGKDLGLFRIGGPGLGNLLFPWARGIVMARKLDLIPIWPTWGQFKLGPFLRNEKDKRMYFDYFLRSDEYLGGIEKIKKIISLDKLSINEEQLNFEENIEDKIVVYSGMKNYFSSIANDYGLVKTELLNIVNSKYISDIDEDFSNSISVHVRMGDFAQYNSNKFLQGVSNTRVPIEWYINIINQIRGDSNTKVFIFTDGSDNELESLLSMPNIYKISFGSAIGDLLALSRSNILIASNSTFSLWAAYLGRMPLVRPPSKNITRLYTSNDEHELSLRLNEKIPTNFREMLIKGNLLN